MSGHYPRSAARRSRKIDESERASALVSDVAVACGKLSSNGPDQNTPSRTRAWNEGCQNLSVKTYCDRARCIFDVKFDDAWADDAL